MTHDHLNLSTHLWGKLAVNRDVLIIDENCLPKLRKEEIVQGRQLKALQEAISSASGMKALEWSWLNPLMSAIKNKDVTPLRLSPICIPNGRDMPKIDRYFLKTSGMPKNMIRTLIQAAQQSAPICYRPLEESGGKIRYDVLAVNIMANLPRLPLFILDSTSKAEYYQWALGEDFEVSGLNPAEGKSITKNARIIQCISGSYPNSSLLSASGDLTRTGQRILEFLRKKTDGCDSYGIVATKKFEQKLLKDFPADKLLHFNKLRGLNVFNDVHHLFIIGYQGMSHTDLARNARILFNQEWDDQQEADKLGDEKYMTPIRHWRHGLQCNVMALKPANPYIQAYLDMMIVGEVEQALGRARIYLPRPAGEPPRELFLLTNLPTSMEIDETMELWKDESSGEMPKLIAASVSLLNRLVSFSREDLRKESGMGKNTVQSRMNEIRSELDLVEVTGRSNKKSYRRRC